MATLQERARQFFLEARGRVRGRVALPPVPANPDHFMGTPQNVHRSAPYIPGEVSRGPFIFPQPGSTNGNLSGLRGIDPSAVNISSLAGRR